MRKNTAATIAYVLTYGMFISLFLLFFVSIPDDNKAIINQILTNLATVWVAAMAYYYGSSTGSKFKDRCLDRKSKQHKKILKINKKVTA